MGYCSVFEASASTPVEEVVPVAPSKVLEPGSFTPDLDKLQKAFQERPQGTNSITIDGLLIESRHPAKLNAFCKANRHDLTLIRDLLPKAVPSSTIQKFTVRQFLNLGLGNTYIRVHFYVSPKRGKTTTATTS